MLPMRICKTTVPLAIANDKPNKHTDIPLTPIPTDDYERLWRRRRLFHLVARLEPLTPEQLGKEILATASPGTPSQERLEELASDIRVFVASGALSISGNLVSARTFPELPAELAKVFE